MGERLILSLCLCVSGLDWYRLHCLKFCSALSICVSVSAGLSEVPAGAVCLSSSQVLAFGQAAVRLEKTQSRMESHSLTRRKSLLSCSFFRLVRFVVCLCFRLVCL